ncbi:magnesium transporter [Bacillus subtilis]|uniref:magnesium transporter n=1 Tax=Pseudochrobactrum asaccharolyticum TaxID=354351 RepID=UPI001F02001D|nr:magnesium transporter [Pseudochrobactrum asaccharolyticum]MCF7644759.1 magnesium transporter [Pseudochrobactrum asaccharolyticum]MCF7670002.1 magnesium transporter [Bacillus subtilis]
MNNNTGTYGAALDTTNLAISALLEQVGQLHTGDAVELINELDVDDQVALFRAVSTDQAVLLLDQPELQYAEQIIASLDTAHAGEILNGMSADRATDIFRDIDWPSRNRLFAILSAETKANLKKLMGYPADTAGGLMTTEFISVPTTWTVEQTLEHIRQVERSRETVYAIYVEDPATRVLKYVVSLRRLIIADPKASIAEVGRDQTPLTVPPLMDQEEVSRLFRKHDLLAIPVVDEQHHLLGIVTVDDVLDAMTEETSEDAYKFGGMEAFTKPYMQIGFFEMLRKRGGWLCILFLSEMLTASAMQHFEVELEKAIVLALFIPLIMSSGGNSGSQATSLLIRALALQDLKLGDWWRVALREIPTGLALGSMLGLIGFVRIAIWQKTGLYDYGEHWVLIGITIGVALIGIVLFGSVSGSMLPFILQRLGLDPASASAPFVATLVDVMGLIIYFSVAVIFLTGTLL